MSVWGCLMGVALLLPSASTPRFPKATEVKQFDFRLSPQGDFNKPEGWVRHQGADYPFYIVAELTSEQFAVGGRSLCFQLNGGNCAYLSPEIEVSADFNYVLLGQIKTVGLTQDQSLLMLEFLDASGKLIGEAPTSARVGGDSDWTVVRVGPVPAPHEARACRVVCVNRAGEVPDLQGKVYFDDLWLGRLPRLEVETSAPFRLFDVNADKFAKIVVRGDEGRNLKAKFYLFDADQKLLAEDAQAVSVGKSESTAQWKIPADQVGFYHLEVALEESGRQVLRRHLPITVLAPQATTFLGEFGISLPSNGFGQAHQEQLAQFAGCRWIKMPLWTPNAPARQSVDERALAELLERLSRKGHVVIGRLDGPPAELSDQLAENEVDIADLLAMPPSIWGPSLEGLLVRYSLKIVHWQLGADNDRSFQGLPNVDQYLLAVQKEASRIGRDIRLGLAWDYFVPPPRSNQLTFLALGDQSKKTGDETPALLSDEQIMAQLATIKEQTIREGRQPAELFLTITPLNPVRYDRRSRIIDLARRAVSAKAASATAIFASDGGIPNAGLLDQDGSPNELFTIWRHLADALAGKSYLGSLHDLTEVTNHVFVEGGRATVVAWADQPKKIEAVLGKSAVVRDLWGRVIQPPSESETRSIEITDMPVLITDADEFLIRWQIGAGWERGSVPGRFGTHFERLVLVNPLDIPVSGSASPRFPPEWSQRPEQISLSILPKETARAPIGITLPQGVSQGEYFIPIDFRLTGQRSYQFRVFRPFRVGGDELRIEARGRLLHTGSYEVGATVTNLTKDSMSLRAAARTLGRPAELDFVPNLSAGASAETKFLFQSGAGLSGQKIRIEFEDPRNRREFTYDLPVE